MVPRIVGRREYSSQLVASGNHAEIAGVGLSVGQALRQNRDVGPVAGWSLWVTLKPSLFD
jgi:hypothetical protein